MINTVKEKCGAVRLSNRKPQFKWRLGGDMEWSREDFVEVAFKPRPDHTLARQRVWGEHSRQKKRHVERAPFHAHPRS